MKVKVIKIQFEAHDIEIDDTNLVKRRAFENALPHLRSAQHHALEYNEQMARAIKGSLTIYDIPSEIIRNYVAENEK